MIGKILSAVGMSGYDIIEACLGGGVDTFRLMSQQDFSMAIRRAGNRFMRIGNMFTAELSTAGVGNAAD